MKKLKIIFFCCITADILEKKNKNRKLLCVIFYKPHDMVSLPVFFFLVATSFASRSEIMITFMRRHHCLPATFRNIPQILRDTFRCNFTFAFVLTTVLFSAEGHAQNIYHALLSKVKFTRARQ